MFSVLIAEVDLTEKWDQVEPLPVYFHGELIR